MRLRIACITVVSLAVAAPISAQTADSPLASLVPDLILRGISLPGADDPGRPHSGHFTLGNPTLGGSQAASRPDLRAIGAVSVFGERLRAQLVNVPLGSSTGGFTYNFDEASGAYTRSSASFGPSFTERASTIGRNKLSVGANYQRSTFDTFGGEDLDDGSITFFLPHTDCCSAAAPPPSPEFPAFEGDVVEAALSLKATTDTFALFANYGVTDRFDLGVAVPITRVRLDANVRATIIRLSTAATPTVHTFVEGQDVSVQSFGSNGSATGIGDVVVRSKYNVIPAGGDALGNASVAVGFDLRLPTGNEDDLLGIGTTQGKLNLIVSSANDRLSPHVNVGYTFSGSGDTEPLYGVDPVGVSDELSYAAGVEWVPHPRVTVLGDFLGRTLRGAGDLEIEQLSFQYLPSAASTVRQTSTSNPSTGQPYRQLALRSDANLTTLLGATGVKFNPTGNLLVGANVLFPLNKSGLRDLLTFAVGIDYAF